MDIKKEILGRTSEDILLVNDTYRSLIVLHYLSSSRSSLRRPIFSRSILYNS